MIMSIRVFKSEYTDRHTPRNRLTYLLKLEAKVPENSYLFLASMPSSLASYTEIINHINKLSKKSKISRDDIESCVKMIDESKPKKNADGFPKINDYFIPGSSLKGVIRSRIEYKLLNNNGAASCYVVNGFQDGISNTHLKFWGDDIKKQREQCIMPNNICIVCDMFGNKELASLTHFSDAIAQGKNVVERLSDIKIEAIKPNTKFECEILCQHYDYKRLGLLFLGLELFSKSPILIGMYKYKYNKQYGKLYNNKYMFGLLNFSLKEVKDINNKTYQPDELLNNTKEELEKSDIAPYINWQRGVIS